MALNVMKQTVQNRLGALEQAASAGGRSVPIDLLAAAMRDPSAKVRSKAVQIVAEHGVEAAVPLVEKLLDDPSDEVRMSAVQSLGCFPAISSVSLEKLKSLLTDSSPLVRIETLEVLASFGDKDALPAIAQLLNDADPLVRASAARSIATLGGLSYIRAIEDALGSEKDDSARAGLFEALFLLGNREALGELLRLLSSSDYRVRCAVANTLEDLLLDRHQSDSAIQALMQAELNALGRADRSSVTRVLSKLQQSRMANR